MGWKDRIRSGAGRAWNKVKEASSTAKENAETNVVNAVAKAHTVYERRGEAGPAVRRGAEQTAERAYGYGRRVRRNVSHSRDMSNFLGVPYREERDEYDRYGNRRKRSQRGYRSSRTTVVVKVSGQGSNNSGGKVKKKRKHGSRNPFSRPF